MRRLSLSRVIGSWPTLCRGPILGLVCAALLAGAAGAQQRERTPPPEPSRAPWVSETTINELQQTRALYQRIAAAGGWQKLPDKVILRPGDSDANIAILRRRLELTGDIAPGAGDPYTFDDGLAAAVKRYQLQNGLEPTGVVYGITQRTLNVPVETRLRQIDLNIARLRELAPRVVNAPRYIVMNAAGFALQGVEGGRVAIVSRTIAGKRATPTPVVSASVQAINILPYWHVPGSIAKAALVPQMRKDPSYLMKERIRVFSTFGGEEIDPSSINWFGPEAERFVFRQDPGPQNALGVLRFDMPNKHIVYMHDTPMKNLFGYYERAYSSGCIRVQNFLDLAEWVLKAEPGWSRPALEQAVATGQGKTIKVSKPVPVHFIYLTAWVENGRVAFRNDLYNRDDDAFDGGEDAAARQLTTQLAP